MGIAPFQLSKTDGLRFGRLMGSGGGNGFSIKPNFGVYAQLGVWDDKSDVETFYACYPWALQAKKKMYRTNVLLAEAYSVAWEMGWSVSFW